jgi:hypothetical protein
MVQAVEYMDRVAKGASVLTEFDKHWPKRVHLKRLDIDNIDACVVVQVVTDCDGFNEAIEWLAFQEHGWATTSEGEEWIEAHGFDAAHPGDMPLLNQLWRSRIRTLRAHFL